MFDADKGLIHFTFANEDTYFKKSFIMLDRQKNLYYELKERNYKTVIFVDLQDSTYRITCGDSSAAKLYERCKTTGFKAKVLDALGIGTFGGDIPQENKSMVFVLPREQKETVLGILDRMMSNSSQTAFVFSMQAMASFQGISSAQKVIIKQKSENYQRRNMLLIVSYPDLQDSFEHLTNPDGIFQTEAFHEIREMCQKYNNLRLYDGMKQKMSERVTYLNDMGRDEISYLLTWAILKQGVHVSERLERREDYTDFLWLLTHSVKFTNQVRKQDPEMKNIFPDNNARRFEILKNNLCVSAAYEHMDVLIDNLRKYDKTSSLISMLQGKIDDTSAEYQQYLYLTDSVLDTHIDALNRAVLDKIKSIVGNTEEMNAKLAQIRKELVRPYIISDQENHRELYTFIMECLGDMQMAYAVRDYDTLKIGIDALYYAVCKCEQQTEKANREDGNGAGGTKSYPGQTFCIQAYRNTLKCQKTITQQSKKFSDYVKQGDSLSRKCAEMLKEIQQMENASPNIKEKAKDMSIHNVLITEYRGLVTEYEALQKERESIEYNMGLIRLRLAEGKKTVAAFLNDISVMEDAAYTIVSHAEFEASIDAMNEMMEKTHKMQEDNKKYFEELKEKNKQFQMSFSAEKDLQDTDLDFDLDLDVSDLNVDAELNLFID